MLQDAKRLLKATSNSLQIRFQELIRFKSRLLDAKGCSQPFSWAREYLLQARSARLDKPAEKPEVPVAVTFVMDATGEFVEFGPDVGEFEAVISEAVRSPV